MKKRIGNIDDNDVKGFLLNFMAVVLGIVITFSGEALISSHNEKKEVYSSLDLVKNELQDNLDYIQMADSVLRSYSHAADFLLKYEGHYDKAPIDSLILYTQYAFLMFEVSASQEALELLKTSSLFTKIKDQKLSLDIIHTYGTIEDRMLLYKMLFGQCNSERDAAVTDEVKNLLSDDSMTPAQCWSVIMSKPGGRNFLRLLQSMSIYGNSDEECRQVEATIEKISAYIGE